jgi:hypothetical protein
MFNVLGEIKMVEAIHIQGWSDMRTHFGINVLTGEACRYGLRLLCDLDENGAGIVRDWLGVVMLGNAWNSTVNDKPAVASIMLPRDCFKALAEFAITRAGAMGIIKRPDGSITGLYSLDMYLKYKGAVGDLAGWEVRRIHNPAVPGVGSRATHAMSGRTV